jgi:hypothetical protein
MDEIITSQIISRAPDAADWWLILALLNGRFLVWALAVYACVFAARRAGIWYFSR